ncbi:MAG: DUF4405 domain-containing protein [Alphaproteobacteria bacterium]|nr:DUF4405 domain-containing protein [Alphaproteobacteria bacterium]
MKRTRFLLILDTILFLSLVVLMEPRTSLTVHEWLGIAFIPLIVVHLLFAWQWIITTLARLGAKGAWRLRINAVLNLALFVTFVVSAFSGVMTSFIALPGLGIMSATFGRWTLLHNQWTVYFQVAAGLHIAMNWSWIVGAVRRHVLARPSARGDAAIAAVAGKAA